MKYLFWFSWNLAMRTNSKHEYIVTLHFLFLNKLHCNSSVSPHNDVPCKCFLVFVSYDLYRVRRTLLTFYHTQLHKNIICLKNLKQWEFLGNSTMPSPSFTIVEIIIFLYRYIPLYNVLINIWHFFMCFMFDYMFRKLTLSNLVKYFLLNFSK